jgi:hypothetical protein
MTKPSAADLQEARNLSNSTGTGLAITVFVANLTSPNTFAPVRQFDRPIQDEWGIFDPQQAGLEALLRKVQSASADTNSTLKPAAPVAK